MTPEVQSVIPGAPWFLQPEFLVGIITIVGGAVAAVVARVRKARGVDFEAEGVVRRSDNDA